MSGKALRLKRFQTSPNGRIVILPLDHGVSLGPIPGLERPEAVVRMGVKEGANALVLYKGIVHLSAGSQLGPSAHHKVLIGTVEEAIRRGADGVSVHINLGNPNEPEMLKDFGTVGDACSEWQVPLLAMVYVRGHADAPPAGDPAIAHAARIAAELGADIIKIPAPEDDRILSEITSSVPVPVVVAGGNRIADAPVFLERVEKAMQAGAQGVAIGRNIFQSTCPAVLLRAICLIVHRGYTAGSAWEESKGGGGTAP